MEIVIATRKHTKYAIIISETIDRSAQQRGTGIAKRTPDYIETKIINGNAIIALDGNEFAGFCYIETFSNKDYVVHSGLIVHENYRKQGQRCHKIRKNVSWELKRKPELQNNIFF